MKVAISTSTFASIDPAPLNVLMKNGIEVIPNPFGRKLTENEIILHLDGIDGLLAGLEPLNANVFSNCPDLKAIARIGIGMENVDLKAAKQYGIKVSNTPEGPTDAVAEMTLAAALTLARNLLPANEALHRREWSKSIGTGLKMKEVLIIGFGRIGRRAAELFLAFGARIKVCDPLLKPMDLINGEILVNLDEGLKSADLISIHAAGSEAIITKNKFNKMKKGVILLNSARGGLVDEEALVSALNSKQVSAAWFDVFPAEPYNGPLSEFDQVLLTPHMSTYTTQCRKDMELAAVKNLLLDLSVG